MRVTVDKDNPTVLELMKTYFNMKYLFGKEPELRVSKSGGLNHHFVVRGLKISFLDSLNLRRFLGDDLNRIHLDEIGVGKPRQVLFIPFEYLTHPDFLSMPFKQIHIKRRKRK